MQIKQKLNEMKVEKKQDIIYIHHVLMKQYGWIPFEEFKQLPIPTILNLLETIGEELKEEQKQYNKVKRRGKH